jgi:hypothetical protein
MDLIPREASARREGGRGQGGVRAPERADSNVRERGAEAPTRASTAGPACVDGGEGGIRTRDGLPRTAFPVRRHSPLGDLSHGGKSSDSQGLRRSEPLQVASPAAGRSGEGGREDRSERTPTCVSEDRSGQRTPGRHAGGRRWRRGRDSNPRCFRTPLFESGTINHSDTSPRQRIPKVVGATGGSVVRRRAGTNAPLPLPRRRTAPRPRRGGYH